MDQIIKKTLPPSILEQLINPSDNETTEELFSHLEHLLPIVRWSPPKTVPSASYATILCRSENAHGVGRHFTDTMSRWLIPGKFLIVYSGHSLSFYFPAHPNRFFFIHQIIMEIADEKELA